MTRRVYLPGSLGEVWDILARDQEARLYAGGTDLLVQLRDGRLSAPALLCLERIPDLKLVEDRGTHLFLGAAATHSELLDHPLVIRHLPVLVKALGVLGSPPIRHMGTLGGNICTASPAGDTLPPLYALEAELTLSSASGSRQVRLRDFIIGPGQTRLGPGEILAGVLAPKADLFRIQHYEKVGLRQALACAVVSLAALINLSASGRIEAARLAWGSVGPTVVRAPQVEAALEGRPFNRETLEEAARLARLAVNPIDDLRASADYRRQVAGNLLLRLLNFQPPPKAGPTP
jgi:CO/xanthine dehydrogenase FAD-binding subunit